MGAVKQWLLEQADKEVLEILCGKIIAESRPLFCSHCDKELIREWDRLYQDAPVSRLIGLVGQRRGKIAERIWPDGSVAWGCSYCGRKVENGNGRRAKWAKKKAT
jgi:hypothetical protein